jgi:O-antigen ligase
MAGVHQALTLTFTFTRASIALAVVGVIVLLLYHRQWLLLAAGAVATVALVAVVSMLACEPAPAAPAQPTARASAASSPAPTSAVEPSPAPTPAADGPSIVDRFADPSDRLALWYTAALMTLDYPVAGVGIHRMAEMLNTDPERYVDTPFGKTTASAHNTILLAGAETGIVGALSMAVLNVALGLIGLLLLIRGRGRPAMYSAAGVAILAFLAQGMLNNLFTVPATATLLAVVVGAFGNVRLAGVGKAEGIGSAA